MRELMQIGGGVVGLVIAIFLFVLAVLWLLMPFYVFQIASDVRLMREMMRNGGGGQDSGGGLPDAGMRRRR